MKKDLIEKICDKEGLSRDEINKKVEERKSEFDNRISSKIALMMIAKECGIEVEKETDLSGKDIDEDEIEMEEGVKDEGIVDITLDDLEKKYIKFPKVGEEIEFTLHKIRKNKNVNAVTKEGKKFKTNLTNVDYKIEYMTPDGEIATPQSWEVVGKVNAICRKMKKIDGIEFKIRHIKDGLKEKEGDNYEVYAKVNGVYKQLSRKTNDWV